MARSKWQIAHPSSVTAAGIGDIAQSFQFSAGSAAWGGHLLLTPPAVPNRSQGPLLRNRSARKNTSWKLFPVASVFQKLLWKTEQWPPLRQEKARSCETQLLELCWFFNTFVSRQNVLPKKSKVYYIYIIIYKVHHQTPTNQRWCNRVPHHQIIPWRSTCRAIFFAMDLHGYTARTTVGTLLGVFQHPFPSQTLPKKFLLKKFLPGSWTTDHTCNL